MRHCCHHITSLNLNHCYWLPQHTVQSAVNKCKNLQELHVIQCDLGVTNLVALVASLTQLVNLSFSISSFRDIVKDVFMAAERTLHGLRRLRVYYTNRELSVMNYIGEKPTLLDYCDGLEELEIGSAEISIPELYRPVVTHPRQHLNVRSMRLASTIHAGALMLFYGTLSQLPSSEIHWTSLLMPNVNLSEFVKKVEFQGCFRNIERLCEVDISGSFRNFSPEVLDLSVAHELRYLNVAHTALSGEHLYLIATHCHKLVGLNLSGCQNILTRVSRDSWVIFNVNVFLSNYSGTHISHPICVLFHLSKLV